MGFGGEHPASAPAKRHITHASAQDGEYGAYSVATDHFTNENPDFLSLFAAGNNGDVSGRIEAQPLVPPTLRRRACSPSCRLACARTP